MGPEREGRLTDARDHEEERARDGERRDRGSEGQPEEVSAEARHRRVGAGRRPLGLDGDVVEHQHPRARHEEDEEHEQVADSEGERRGGDQHEKREERHVAQIAQGVAHREAVDEVDRRRERGDEHEPAREPRHRVHPVAERLVPPRREGGERGRHGARVADQPRELEGREAVVREEKRREAERHAVRHAQPSGTRSSRSPASDGGGTTRVGSAGAPGSKRASAARTRVRCASPLPSGTWTPGPTSSTAAPFSRR